MDSSSASHSSSSQEERSQRARSHWAWIPSLYFSEGLPYVIVMTVSVIMYKKLGISNTEIALYTSWLYLPWVIKPFWSPLVEVLRTKRWWIVVMQLLIGAGLAGVAFTIPTSDFLQYTLAFLWLMAFSSATHDIAADGFYMMPLTTHEQAWFVGIRSTFYRLAMITGQGLLVMLAGSLEESYGLPQQLVVVQATAEAPTLDGFETANFDAIGSADTQQLLVANNTYQLSFADRSPEEVSTLVDQVRSWNLDHGFYQEEVTAGNIDESDQAEEEESTWVDSLEHWIVDNFGPSETTAAVSAVAGDVAIIQMRLSQPLAEGEQRVVNLSQQGGDPSFKIVEGSRFTITAENSQQPFAAVVQVDHRLDKPSAATFRALSGDTPTAWKVTFLLAAAFFIVICLYHFLVLPRPANDQPAEGAVNIAGIWKELLIPFGTFFSKPGIFIAILFLMFYRFSEAQLVKLSSPFLLDSKELGGLALSTGEVGFAYGTVGIILLTLGGILGGLVAARNGLKYWLWWMVLAINLPNAVYVFLSQVQPESYLMVNLAVAIEQFGYGFGFTAYMLFMLYISQGKYETAHYAICTGFMALGMMIPGMFSGWLQELVGYQHFFIWVMIATLPSFLVCMLVNIDENFGKGDANSEDSAEAS